MYVKWKWVGIFNITLGLAAQIENIYFCLDLVPMARVWYNLDQLTTFKVFYCDLLYLFYLFLLSKFLGHELRQFGSR